MTERKIRIGFVGVGNMGQAAHLRNYAALPDCAVVAIAELRPALAEEVARRYSVPRVYQDAGEMLAHEQLDGIVAPQQFSRHGQLIPPLYRAGIPVLTEKPLAASVAVGERMLVALQGGGSWHMVGYHKRNDPPRSPPNARSRACSGPGSWARCATCASSCRPVIGSPAASTTWSARTS